MRDLKRPTFYPFDPEDLECEEWTLNGDRAWITVGSVSLLIKKHDNCVSLTAFPLGREDEDPINEMVLWNEDYQEVEP